MLSAADVRWPKPTRANGLTVCVRLARRVAPAISKGMSRFPQPEEAPPGQRAQARVFLRYEDVAQDGSLKVWAIPHAMGAVAYAQLWDRQPLYAELVAQGVVPILSRVRIQSTGSPISVEKRVEVDGWYRLGHTRDTAGDVNRILLVLGAEIHAARGRTYDPQPPGAGERIHVGRMFAEHVFTRPFGDPRERKVFALQSGGRPFVPDEQMPFEHATSCLELPSGARALDEGFVQEAMPVVFGLAHTDSNQHVNSVAYLELFEDAALRRMFALGRDTAKLLVDDIEVAYRKPCFAGQAMYIQLRVFESDGALGAVGYLGPEGASPEAAHCTCRLVFRSV
jgi:hypothetical protein